MNVEIFVLVDMCL